MSKPSYEHLYNDMKDQRDHALARIARLEAQLAAVGEGWRPVSEPPAEEGEYIVAGEYPGEDVFTTACAWHGGEWLSRRTELPIEFRVLLWRPLPAPPPE